MGHSSHAESTAIKNPGPYQVSSTLKTAFLVMVIIGVVSFGTGVMSSPERAWASFVHNHFYFMSLALGGSFLTAINLLTGAMWATPLKRVYESYTAYLPFVLVTFIGLVFGLHSVYEWTHLDVVQADPILAGKSSYLNVSFFVIRNVVAILIWLFFTMKMVGNSLEQDKSGDYSLTVRARSMAPLFLICFAITYTMASFDQIMSIDPHWFSTIFGVYCFAGLFYSTLALTAILTIQLRRRGPLAQVVNENHLHDLGKFMFAFTVFWAYIGFSQFMLIWYANMPEETGWYILRLSSGWVGVSLFLLLGKFVAPFILLLPRDSKRKERVLTGVGAFMLFAHWVDLLWLVQPQFFKEGPKFGFVEIGTFLGFAGVFGICVSRFFSRHNLVATGDPRLAESVFHHHQ